MKTLTYAASAATLALLVSAGTIQATTFNFQQAIDNSYTGTITMNGTTLGNPTGERGGINLVWTQNTLALTVTASATGTPATQGYDPDYVYLDKGTAGVGVCGTLTNSFQCNPSSDDNVTIGEWLNFNFNTNVTLDLGKSLFRDENHHIYSPIPSGIWLEVDGAQTFDLGSNGNGSKSFFGSDFRFWTSSDTSQFYISSLEASPVPEPATMLLFGSGLAGLITARARKNKSS